MPADAIYREKSSNVGFGTVGLAHYFVGHVVVDVVGLSCSLIAVMMMVMK